MASLRVSEEGGPHSLSTPANIVQEDISKFKAEKKLLHITCEG